MAFEAGRIMLKRIQQLLREGKSFGFETTLATRSYQTYLHRAHELGYKSTLCFIWLSSPELAKERVKKRVASGGHNIPDDIIERRYYRGLTNFFTQYESNVDEWMFISSLDKQAGIIAEKQQNQGILIHDPLIWKKIKRYDFRNDL